MDHPDDGTDASDHDPDLDRDPADEPLDSWARVHDDGVELVVPPDELAALLTALERGAARFPHDLAIEAQEPDGPRELSRSEVVTLIDDASATCRAALVHTPPVLDETSAGLVAQASAILATIWSMTLQAADESPSAEDVRWVGALGRLAADCEDMFHTRIRPRSDGTYALHWGVIDRRVVRDAVGELRGLVSSDDPSIARLHPTAYGDDEERNAGWDVFVRGELIEKRHATMDVTEHLLGCKRCDTEELAALTRCLNDARLVLGTRLDVGEEGLPPSFDRSQIGDVIAYERLSHLVALAVDALDAGL